MHFGSVLTYDPHPVKFSPSFSFPLSTSCSSYQQILVSIKLVAEVNFGLIEIEENHGISINYVILTTTAINTKFQCSLRKTPDFVRRLNQHALEDGENLVPVDVESLFTRSLLQRGKTAHHHIKASYERATNQSHGLMWFHFKREFIQAS